MAKSTSELISAIQNRASIAESDDRFSDDNLVALMNEELEETVTPLLAQLSEEYLIVKKTIALQTSGVNNYPTLIIPIPKRAYGRTIRELQYLDSDDNLVNIPYVALPDEDKYRSDSIASTEYPIGFYFKNDAIRLIGDADALDGSLVIHYILKPSTIVNKTTEYATITNASYSSGTTTITVGSTGTEFDEYATTGSVKLYDVFRKSTGAIVACDVKITRSALSTTFTTTDWDEDTVTEIKAYQEGGHPVTGAYTSDLYLLPAGRAMYSTIPPEMDNYLVAAVSGRYLEALSDTEGLQVNDSRMQNINRNLSSAFGDRATGEAKVIVARRGLGRAQKRGW